MNCFWNNFNIESRAIPRMTTNQSDNHYTIIDLMPAFADARDLCY